MRIDVFTLFPHSFEWFRTQRHVSSALARGHALECVDLRATTPLSAGQVDDTPFGGGAGMVLRVDVVEAALRGEPLLVAREDLPDLDAEEFWAHDIVGCAVVDGDVPVGEVARLVGLPSVDVLEVVRPGGGEPLLIPLVRDAVRSVDPAARRVDVDLGFLGAD